MSGLRFGRKQRLLTAADYQSVFRRARYKVSCRTLLVLAISNQLPFSRVGLVVGKKHLKRAVDRNRVKRLLRESFRHHQQELEGLDLVVLVRANPGRKDKAGIRHRIDTLLQDLIRRGQRKANN